MSPNGAARVVALLLALGVAGGFLSTFLVQAGLPMWAVLLLVLAVVAVSVGAAMRSGRRSG